MLTIRFNRTGKKNRAQFRIVLQEHTVAPGGRHIDVLGSWDPHQKKGAFQGEKIKEWIAKGAQVSDSVWNLLIRQGIIEGEKRAIKIHHVKPGSSSEIPKGSEANFTGQASPQNAGFNGVKKPAEAKTEENKTEAVAEKAEVKETAKEPAKKEEAKIKETKTEKVEEIKPDELQKKE